MGQSLADFWYSEDIDQQIVRELTPQSTSRQNAPAIGCSLYRAAGALLNTVPSAVRASLLSTSSLFVFQGYQA